MQMGSKKQHKGHRALRGIFAYTLAVHLLLVSRIADRNKPYPCGWVPFTRVHLGQREVIEAKQQIIEELKAYKKSPIWEVVTGKHWITVARKLCLQLLSHFLQSS